MDCVAWTLLCVFEGVFIVVFRATASGASQVFDTQDLWCKTYACDGLDDLSTRKAVCWALCHCIIESINLGNPM